MDFARRMMKLGLDNLGAAQSTMDGSFSVSGAAVTKTETGEYKSNPYTQSSSGPGWSSSVDSTGRATVIANGVDVSIHVDDGSAGGFRWSDVIPGFTIVV
jgi:hypothetical protein